MPLPINGRSFFQYSSFQPSGHFVASVSVAAETCLPVCCLALTASIHSTAFSRRVTSLPP
jgi:hypothetical protein